MSKKRDYNPRQKKAVSSEFCETATKDYSVKQIRTDAKKLFLYNGTVRGAVRTLIFNVLGKNGTKLQAKVVSSKGKPSNSVNQKIEQRFENWAQAESADASGSHTFQRLLWLILQTTIVQGECFIRLINYPFGENNNIPFALQLLEPDMLVDQGYQTFINGDYVANGIKYNQWHRPIEYYFYRNVKKDYYTEHITLPAPEILHVKISNFYNDPRGQSWLTASLKTMKDLDELATSSIVNSKVQSLFAGFIKSDNAEEFGGFGDSTENDEDIPISSEELKIRSELVQLAPGLLQELKPGEDITFADPTKAASRLVEDTKYFLRSFSSDIGISYETVTNDYQGINYGTQRAALLNNRQYYEWLQYWFVDKVCNPIFKKWLVAAQSVQAVPIGEIPFKWTTRGWEWIDPQKDANAAISRIEHGLSTITSELSSTGLDFESIADQRRAEIDYLDGLKLGSAIANHPDYLQNQNGQNFNLAGKQPAPESSSNGEA